MRKSIWESIKFSTDEFREDKVDVLIIGAGITGITLSYYLMNSNKKVMLIDKGLFGSGTTYKSTAKITYLQKDIYQKLEDTFDEKTARLYFESQQEAIDEIVSIIEKENISASLEKVSSIIFTLLDKNKSRIERERDILKSYNIDTFDVESEKIKRGVGVDNTFQFSPTEYLLGLLNIIKNKVLMYQNVCATDIEKERNSYKVVTNKGVIYAKSVVVSTNYPFFIKPLFLPLKAYVKREYVNVGDVRTTGNYTAISIDDEIHSVRFYKNHLLYTSISHKLTDKIDYAKNYEKSKENFRKYFNIKSRNTWVNQDIMSNDNLPFIGEVNRNLYVATAYNGWGMTNGTIAAKVISDLIMKGDNKYQKLFNPKRINLSLVLKSFFLMSSYIKVYFWSLFKKNNPYYIKIEGVVYGVYKDSNNVEHKIKLICPHMKCHLVFNQAEKTWDCPCHGSRFDLDGKLLVAPSKENLQSVSIDKNSK